MIKLGFVGNKNHFLRVSKSFKNLIGFKNITFFNHHDSIIFENNKQTENINYDDFLSRCDALYFFEDPLLNFNLVEKALKHTKHCYLESPKFFSYEDVKRINKIQLETRSSFVIGEISQQVFKNLNKELPLKPPFIINVNHSGEADLMEMLLTDIDFVVHFLNSDLRKVEALGLPVTHNLLNVINSNLYFRNGSVVSLIIQKTELEQAHKMAIYSQNGYANLNFIQKSVKLNGDIFKVGNGVENIDADYFTNTIKSFIQNVLKNSRNDIANEKNLSAIQIKDLVNNKIKRSLSA